MYTLKNLGIVLEELTSEFKAVPDYPNRLVLHQSDAHVMLRESAISVFYQIAGGLSLATAVDLLDTMMSRGPTLIVGPKAVSVAMAYLIKIYNYPVTHIVTMAVAAGIPDTYVSGAVMEVSAYAETLRSPVQQFGQVQTGNLVQPPQVPQPFVPLVLPPLTPEQEFPGLHTSTITSSVDLLRLTKEQAARQKKESGEKQ